MHYFYDEKTDTIFEYCIIPAVANQERLFKMTKWAELTNEVKMWLDENIGANHWMMYDHGVVIGFVCKEDAMAFMLRWS